MTKAGFQVPEGIEAEPVATTLQNDTDVPHVAFFARLNEGVNPEQVEEALPKGDQALFGLITVAGSLPRAEPGSTSEAIIQFPEGSYLVWDPAVNDSPPIGFFDVSAALGPTVKPPETAFTIEVGEYYFRVDGAQAGATTVEITNRGRESHQVLIFESGGGPAEFFSMAPAPDGSLWISIDLQSGTTYEVACLFIDPKTGKPHQALGMRTTVTVD